MDKCLELSNMSLKQDTVDDISSSPTLFSMSVNIGAAKRERREGKKMENTKRIREGTNKLKKEVVMGIIHNFFPLQSLYSRFKKHQLGDEHDLRGRTPLLQKQASLFLYSGLCVFGSFHGRGAALFIATVVSSGLGRKKNLLPQIYSKSEN